MSFALAALAASAAALYALGPGLAVGSSHREAPSIASDPAADNTDLFVFRSPDRDGYLSMIANFIPFEEPEGGPNFYPFATDAVYYLNVDSDGDCKPDARFRYKFQNVDNRGNNTFLYNNGPVTTLDDENLLFRQTYTLESSFNGAPYKMRATNVPVAPSYVGAASMPDYAKLRTDATVTLQGGWRTFAGQADDPFALDLGVFNLLYNGDLTDVGKDSLAGFNVDSIALEVPFSDVALKGDATRNPVIGVWTTVERPRVRMAGGNNNANLNDTVQVSRLGNPLVNEVVIPAGLKDAFNSLSPDKDATIPAVVQRVNEPEVPKLIEAIYKIPAPATPRKDLFEIFLTGISTKTDGPIKADLNSQLMNQDVDPKRFQPCEVMRLNLSVPVTAQPNRLGVIGGDLQGYPNGRRLTDDAVDISLQAVEGAAQTGQLVEALAKGDGVDANDQPFGNTFPYLALPNGQRGSAAAPAPAASASVKPAASSSDTSGDMMMPMVAASIAAGGGLLFFVGWWMRRQRRERAGS